MQKRIDRPDFGFDWDHARLFLSVVNTGSLTAAASEAGVSQSTLSRQMAALETQLGMTLFERVGRGIQVTESGEQLIAYLKVMQEAADQIALTAAGQADSLSGKVTLSVSELDSVFRIPRVVKLLRERAPDIQLEIVATNTVSNLKAREADIAIRNARPEQPDLIAKKMAEEDVDLFGEPQYVAKHQKQSFQNAQVVSFEDTNQIKTALNNSGWQFEDHNFQLRTNFQWLQLQLAQAGEGLIILPTDIGKHRGLTPIRPKNENSALMTLPVWLVSHRELRTNPRVKFVFDLIAENVVYK